MAGANGNGYTNGHTNGHTNGYKNGHTNGHNRLSAGSEIVIGDRLPPYNIEAEKGSLGSMIRDNSMIPAILAIVDVDDYYRDIHQHVLRSIERLHKAGRAVDVITLEDDLEKAGVNDDVGGVGFLMELVEAAPVPINGVYHAQIVHEKAVARDLVVGAQGFVGDGYSGQYIVEELLEKLRGITTKAESKYQATGGEDDAPAPFATLADIRRHVGEVQWLWPHWIIGGQMTVLAADPATGKTRMTLDLCRRMWHGLPWPDRHPHTVPPGTPSFWVASDRNHGEIMRAAVEFDLPDEAICFNAPPGDPFGGLLLDDPAEVRMLRRRVKAAKPGLIVIDTINKATRQKLYQAQDADRFFAPLLDIARDLGIPILALTHLSKGGESLDRRIEGTCRVLIKLQKPEGDETTNLRKLFVSAIREGRAAAPLRVEMLDGRNDYTSLGGGGESSDVEPAPITPVRPPVLQAAIDWTVTYLSKGPMPTAQVREATVKAGHTLRTFDNARKAIGVVTEGKKLSTTYRLRHPGEEVIEGQCDAGNDESEGEGPTP